MAASLLVAIAVPAFASAQVRPDSVRKDTVRVSVPVPPPPGVDTLPKRTIASDSAVFRREVARTDSIKRAIAGDTIKAPLARFERPDDFETSPRLRFSREEILSSGAVNLADLLDRVPGVTTYRSGWIAGVHAASFAGDTRRLRLFVDGVEMDAIEPRNGGTIDLTDVPLWTLDELVVERAAGEVRVWMRTWTVERTTPYTRADIFTGDLNTNAFRGLFARRWRNGVLLQLGGQQVATQSGRVNAFTGAESSAGRGDGTVQGFMARIGWSKRRVSVDLFANASARERDPHTAREGFTDLLAYKGSRRDAYLRVGYGDTLRGFWSQAIIGVVRTRLEGIGEAVAETDSTPAVVTDTIRGRTQQLLAAGYRTSRWSVSMTDRVRPIDGTAFHAPAVRGRLGGSRYAIGAFAEENGADSTRRIDLSARAQPFSWLILTGAQSTRTPDSATGRVSGNTLRAEAALKVGRLWIGGGVIRDNANRFESPVILGTPAALVSSVDAQGVLASAAGRLYKDVRLDVQAIRWDGSQYNRPQLHVRTEIALISDWRRRFPRGEFSINARIWHELRDGVPFFYGTEAGSSTPDVRITERANVMTGLLELRIQRATLFYQYRNLTGGAYEQIRGITMPPAVQMYGVRWEFWN
ncbi:TonB-dependent receptor plug domain-containing protein [Gemmatimonas groenlandica]|uniref:Plug domain-containing protein n=1 Tax=Gemmatimonas groenlandica TaxID=2732249 RepID=A0A6M4IK56_9BACT|nr:Plug domain-containing protein [Gemmatimonas groenlandica]QJR35020.1 Plug domain-containing protein [Gemmatimonas groenlandica]